MVERIRAAARLEELIGERTELRRKGRRLFGLCPLHDENTPSLSVDVEEQLWHCFGCRRGGDVFGWVMETERVDFLEAMRFLARKYGVEWEEPTPAMLERRALELAVEGLLAGIARRVALDFPGSAGENYVAERGVDGEVARAAGCGWCAGPRTIGEVVAEVGAGADVVEASGIFGHKDTATWDDRLVVPLIVYGRVRNFYTRVLHHNPDRKGEWHRFLSGRQKLCFGVDEARRSQVAVVTEGVFDALACRTAGMEGACAYLGVPGRDNEDFCSTLGRRHERVVIALDCDEEGEDGSRPGQEAAVRLASDVQATGQLVDVADLGAGDDVAADPNDVLLRLGPEALRRLVLDEAMEPVVFADRWDINLPAPLLEVHGSALALRMHGRRYIADRLDNVSDAHGLKATVELYGGPRGKLLQKDTIGFYSQISRRRFANAAARRAEAEDPKAFGDAIDDELLRLDGELTKYLSVDADEDDDERDAPVMTDEEREEALELLRDPRLLERVVEDVHALGVVREDHAVVVGYLTMTSRRMDDPLFLCAKGESSVGKSWVMGAVARLCPPEDLRDLSRITPKALFYVEDDWARHKLLLVRERVGGEEADYSIRTMLSEKGLSILVPERDADDRLVTHERVVEGPIAYIETTTEIELNPENETRLLELYLDDSVEQTAAIHDEQREGATVAGLRARVGQEGVLRVHRNAQRLLDRVAVVVPYATLLDFPARKPRHRRDHAKFVNLLRVIAFLHQHRKERRVLSDGKREVPYIETDVGDYALAYELAGPLFGPTMDELDARARDFLLTLWHWCEGEHQRSHPSLDLSDVTAEEVRDIRFTRKQAAEGTGLDSRTTNRFLGVLVEMDFLDSEGRQGQTYRYSFATSNPQRPSLTELVDPAELNRRWLAEQTETEESSEGDV